jgi:hypothetical protein
MPRNRMSGTDVERLLCGKSPENKALTPLAPVLSAFHNVTWPTPTEEAVTRFAAEAASVARSPTGGAMLAPSPPARRSRFLIPVIPRRLATGLAGVLLVSGLAGVAVASDESAPGDILYGLDRALESIGVGAGGASERISEAWALFERGQVAEAVRHASQAVDAIGARDPAALPSTEASNAADALQSAAGRVGTSNDNATSLEVKAAVAAMLTEMSAMLQDPDLEGKDFGQNVAEIARSIGTDNTPSSSVPDLNAPGSPESPGPGYFDPASTPPFDSPPGLIDDSTTSPTDPPGKSGEAPGKTDSSPGKSDEKPANPPTRP